jgi:hypothetical protein
MWALAAVTSSFSPSLLQRRRQRHEEARLEVAVKPLNLAFGLGSVRTTQSRPEAELLSYGEKVAMKAVLAGTIGIALDDYVAGLSKSTWVGTPPK